jgi:TonB family protein
MKKFAILFSIIYCSVFCTTSYSQNISDSAITTIEDIVVSIEYDKVCDEYHYVAEIKDFFSSKYNKGYSDERYGSYKYYEELHNEAYKEAIRNMDSRKMGTFIYSFIPDKHKRKLGNQGWGVIVFNLSKTEGLLKYSLTIRADEGIKPGRVFTKDDCLNIFHALDTSIFNSWSEDIDYLTGAIKFRLQEPEEEALGWNYHEEPPKFNGGAPQLMTQWVKERQVYPRKALKLGLEGRVTIQFTISEKGKLKNVKVLRGVHKSLDRASLQLVKSTAGLWTPGEDLHHKPCSRTFTFPVIWELPEDKTN